MPAGFAFLIAAPFFSALADNALLIVGIALLHAQQLPPWIAPLLKFGFTLAYVVLAPFVGPLADAVPKARLMAWMNGVKVLGVLALLAGVHPVAGFALVGIGAAAYAPAKYGLITEIVAPRQLVAANGWIEASIVCAVLLGTVCGGVLVSPAWLHSAGAAALRAALGLGALDVSLVVLLGVYALAALLNLGAPVSAARYPRPDVAPAALLRSFRRENRVLWSDRDGGLSLAATTVFWGAGATLQFVVLDWATDMLGLPLSQAAYLQGVVAVGVIAGAAGAARWIPLERARAVLGAGVLLGLAVPVLALVDTLALALPLLAVTGLIGGLLVVPMNALLQHRGVQLLSAGRSIAVQGCNENASVLAMLAAYAALQSVGVRLDVLMAGFGVSIAATITWLMWRSSRATAAAGGGRSTAPVRPRSGR
jgi:LPLT family lysophospholipid transporter-like MFS transporter